MTSAVALVANVAAGGQALGQIRDVLALAARRVEAAGTNAVHGKGGTCAMQVTFEGVEEKRTVVE
jgi:hypothetical protein